MKPTMHSKEYHLRRQSPPPRLPSRTERLRSYHVSRPSPTASDASFVPLTPVLSSHNAPSQGSHSQQTLYSPNVGPFYSTDDLMVSSSGIIMNSGRLSSGSERMKSPSSGESHQMFRIPVTVGSTRQEMIFYGDYDGRGLSAQTCTQSSTEALTDYTHTSLEPSPAITAIAAASDDAAASHCAAHSSANQSTRMVELGLGVPSSQMSVIHPRIRSSLCKENDDFQHVCGEKHSRNGQVSHSTTFKMNAVNNSDDVNGDLQTGFMIGREGDHDHDAGEHAGGSIVMEDSIHTDSNSVNHDMSNHHSNGDISHQSRRYGRHRSHPSGHGGCVVNSLFELMVSCIVGLIGCIIVILLKVTQVVTDLTNLVYMLLIVVFVSAVLCLVLVLCKARRHRRRERARRKRISSHNNQSTMHPISKHLETCAQPTPTNNAARESKNSIELPTRRTIAEHTAAVAVTGDVTVNVESTEECVNNGDEDHVNQPVIEIDTPERPELLLGQCYAECTPNSMIRVNSIQSHSHSDSKSSETKSEDGGGESESLRGQKRKDKELEVGNEGETETQGEEGNSRESDEEIVYNKNGLILTKKEIQSYLDHRKRRKRRRKRDSSSVGGSLPKCPVGRWYKGDCIGCGSFSKVFMALSHDTGQVFVVKQVPLIKDGRGQRVYKQELRTIHTEISTLSQLSHPNIVSYLGSSTTSNHFNIFLEYMPGGSLTKLVKSLDSPLDIGLLRSWMAQILNALSFLHSKDIIHRDIKGANILLDSMGNVKLGDFGAAKDLTQVCTASSIQGTAHWMAPEVVRQMSYNMSADIWSLGITCIELCNGGKPPFYKRDPISVIHLIGRIADWVDPNHKETENHHQSSDHSRHSKSKNPLNLIEEAIPERIGEDGSDFIRRCLKGNPNDRPTADYLLYEHPFLTAEMEEPTDVCSEQKDEVIAVVSGNLEYENQVRNEMLKMKEDRYQRHRQRQKILRESQIKARELKKEHHISDEVNNDDRSQNKDGKPDSPESTNTIPI